MNTLHKKSMTQSLFIKALMVFAIIFSTAASAAQSYKLYGDARAGSRFKPVEVISPIPLDKNYKDMTESQQNWFKNTYYADLSKSEVPPYPVKGTKTIYKPLIKHRSQQLDKARSGTLFMVAMIDATGKVESVSVYESPSSSITELATTVIYNTKFTPASCDGKPCKMEFPFEFKMKSLKK